jgi:hypothetical protein
MNNGGVMLPVKPNVEPYPPDHVRNPFGRFPSDYCAPTSPKIHELKARYEALHATEKNSAHSDFKIVHP